MILLVFSLLVNVLIIFVVFLISSVIPSKGELYLGGLLQCIHYIQIFVFRRKINSQLGLRNVSATTTLLQLLVV